MKFIRYGSLVPQQHDIDEEPSFHQAPVEYGFYAFPKGYVEPFLLGGVGSGSLQNGRYSYLKNDNGKRITGLYRDFYEQKDDKSEVTGYVYKIWTWKQEWLDYFKKHHIKKNEVKLWTLNSTDMEQSEMAENAEGMEDVLEYAIVRTNKPRIFDYDGLIWHHLYGYCVQQGDYGSCTWKDKELIAPCDIIKRAGSWVLTDMRVYKKALETYMRWWKYDCAKDNKYSNRGNYPISNLSKDSLEVYIETIQHKTKKDEKKRI